MNNFEYQYLSNSEQADKLLVFLHGYNNTQDEMSHIYSKLLEQSKNLAIITPIGKYTSLSDVNRHSWWKISNFDAEGKRFNPETAIDEIISIYDKAGNLLSEVTDQLNNFIDNIQKQYNFTDKQTYVAGFSQGALLGIWVSLMRKSKIKGCFSFSGLLAAKSELEDKICSKPKIYLFHGKKDKQVLYKCMEYSIKALNRLGVETVSKSFEDLAHEVNDAEIGFVADIINKDYYFPLTTL